MAEPFLAESKACARRQSWPSSGGRDAPERITEFTEQVGALRDALSVVFPVPG